MRFMSSTSARLVGSTPPHTPLPAGNAQRDALHLALREAHDRHGPGPDISKYDRQMPNVPERSPAFDATFEPEEYLVKVRSGGSVFAPDQQEELIIRYREALAALPAQPGLERDNKPTPERH